MKGLRKLLIIPGLILAFCAFCAFHTFVQLNTARSKGVYESPEQGMLAYAEKYYSADHEVKILYAGPNDHKGRQPYAWYVIAEIHASSHVDGSEMRHNGCDAPGLAYLQTRQGWVYVPEGALPSFIGFWLKAFGLAGEGQVTPTTDLLPPHTTYLCGSHDLVYYGK